MGENALLEREVRGKWKDWVKPTGRIHQHKKHSLKHTDKKKLEVDGLQQPHWVPSLILFSQLRTGSFGYSKDRLTKMG